MTCGPVKRGVFVSELNTQWKQTGSVLFPPGLVPGEQWEEIAAEALALRDQAFGRVNSNPATVAHRDGSITAPQRCRAHPGGEALAALARSREIVELAREATGHPGLIPVRHGLKFYRAGDFMALHRDEVRCSLTISFGLVGDLGCMGWLPELRAADTTTVLAHAERHGPFPDTAYLPIPYRQLQGFDGWGIPHHRPPFEHDFGVLGTFCYFAL